MFRALLLAALTMSGTAMTTPPAVDLQRVLEREVSDGGGPGIVADLRDRHAKPWFGTAGVADLTTGSRRRPGEHFRIGSFTKAFTGTVVLQLAAAGKLSLDDTVAKWLPGVVEDKLGGDGTKISIRQLLNHTSGLPDAVPGKPTPPPEEPGKRFIYSKVNYNLAGMIVERATGSTLAEQIQRRIAGPLHLMGTYLPGADNTLRDPHARHYSKFDEAGRPTAVHDVTDADLSWAGAAGGMVSTTSDLHRFLSALLRGRLLPPAQQKEMFTTVSTEGSDWVPDTRYGLGVYSQTLGCGRTLWGGGGYIQGSVSYAMGDRRGTRVLVSNLNGDWNDFYKTMKHLFEPTFC
ncbi:serine hydrolase domain-containing protein [Nonomuraea sediminis]|uniref:serine hydrolase domain-containing protein n=1 Tax=Nonomuraea sediminis TaxID=2835864 RepID=UPI001BDCB521|nr:serine hydrolase domain-containing protein [Nonomuraea sediminis]